MTTGPNIGYATLSVIPSMQGVESALTKGFVGPSAAAGAKAGAAAGKGFSASFAKFTVIGIGAAAVVGAALLKIGDSFDQAFDKIRITTGKTGTELEGLKTSFKNVFSSVPVSMGQASDAVSTLNQGLGLTGKPLESLAKQVLNLSRLTGTDLSTNVASTTKLFNLWAVAAEQQGPKLDELFRVSQKTGISFGALAEQMASSGTQFKAAGFTFDETAALLGLLAKNGLSASDVLPALNRALATAAKAGKPAAQVFKETFDQIKGAPNDAAAAGVALDVFGAKAGPKFAALIREGKLSYEEFTKAISSGGDTIAGAAKATDDWRESLKVLTNKALVLLEPIATRVFSGMTTLIDGVSKGFEALARGFSGKTDSTGFIGFLERLGAKAKDIVEWFKENWPTIRAVVKTVLDAVGAALTWVATVAFPAVREAVEAVVIWVRDNWPKIVKTFQDTINEIKSIFHDVMVTIYGLIDAGRAVVDWFKARWHDIEGPVRAVLGFFTTEVWPQLQKIWNAIKGDVEGMVKFFQDRWNGIKDAVHNVLVAIGVILAVTFGPIILFFQGAWDNIKGIVKNAIDFLINTIHAGLEVIKGIIDIVTGILTLKWDKVWKGIQEIFGGVWEGIVNIATLFVSNVREVIEGFLSGIYKIWQAIWGLIGPWLDKNVFAPIRSAWDTFFGAIETGIRTGIEAVMLVWYGLKAAYDWVNKYVIDPIKGAFKIFWDGLETGFKTVVDGIKKAWDLLTAIVKAPINFVIGFYNNGIRLVWNFVADKIGLPTLGTITPLNSGGLVPGQGPDQDSVLTYLTPGEFVLNRKATDALPISALEALNAGKPFWKLELNAGGPIGSSRGPYAHTPEVALQWASQFNGRPWIAYTQGPNGFDCSGFMSAITSYIHGQANPFSLQNRWSTPIMPRQGGYGFVPGLGPPQGFSIGMRRGTPGRVGHVIGTLAGVGVESSSTPGVRVPSPNNASTFGTEKFHLPDFDRLFTGKLNFKLGGPAGVIAGAATSVASPLLDAADKVVELVNTLKTMMGNFPDVGGKWGGAIFGAARALGEGVVKFVGGKVKDVLAQGSSTLNPGLPGLRKLFGAADGGTIPGPRGQARFIIGHGGEVIFNDAQQTALWAGLNGAAIARAAVPIVHVYIGDTELKDIVRVEVDEGNRRTISKVRAGVN